MEFNEVLTGRRSIRKFDTSKQVTKEQIEEVVKAAQVGPTWKNSQTARYYACVTEDARKKLAEALPSFNAVSSDGAALIVTTFIPNRSGFEKATGEPTNECGNGWGYYDLGLCNENMLLKATEMGLGSLVMGIRDAAKIRETLCVPEEEVIVSVIAIGYPNIEPVMPVRKETADVVKFF